MIEIERNRLKVELDQVEKIAIDRTSELES